MGRQRDGIHEVLLKTGSASAVLHNMRVYRHELNAERVDSDALLKETRRDAGQSLTIAWKLFERFRVAGIAGSD